MTEWTAVGASLRANSFHFLSGLLDVGYDISIGKIDANVAQLPRKDGSQEDSHGISLATVVL